MTASSARAGAIQDALGILQIGDGYLLRSDGVAVGIAEVSPPDLRLHDEESLFLLLQAYEQVLRSTGDRCIIYTYAVPPDVRPLMSLLRTAQAHATEMTSYMVLSALTSYLEGTLRHMASVPTIRWILATPSEEPEAPPRGTWGELSPSAIMGKLNRMSGDPVHEAVVRIRRLVHAMSSLGVEPPPRVLAADEIRALVAMALDPIHAQAHPFTGDSAHVRPLQIAEPLTPPARGVEPLVVPPRPHETEPVAHGRVPRHAPWASAPVGARGE